MAESALAANVQLYRRLVGGRIRSDLQYRTSFALFLVGQLAASGFDFAVIAAIFANVDSLAGWSAPEVAFLYGVSGIGFGLADLFVSQVEQASVHLKAGTFDAFLVRPVSSLLQLCAIEFSPRRIGRIIAPATALVLSLPLVDVDWTPAAMAMVGVAIVSGAAIFGALFVLTSSIAFWTVETQEFSNAFTYGSSTLTSYPVDVLGTWMRRVVIYVIPVAFVAYLPGAWLFDRPVAGGLSSDLAWLAPVIALGLGWLASLVWRLAIRHHRSTGS